jgi:beta-glucosidase
MALEEKLAQLGSVWSYRLLEGERFSRAKAEELLKHGIGQLTRPAGATGLPPEGTAEFVNSVQRFLVEETRLGIPALVHEECLSGALARGSTLFPQPIALASTWMPDLAREMAERIREELLALGARQGLAPVVDVARDPRWGRVEETFGEDPYLIATMGTAYVQGLQGDDLRYGVVATLKHLAGYGASEGGLNCAPAHIPERELREVYLFPFECAIRAGGALSVMHSYGEIDGVPCAASRWLLTQILRDEWGFPGVVVSDYSGVEMLCSHHHLARDKAEAAQLALQAGVDVELPEVDCFAGPLRELVEQGLVSEGLIDQAMSRILQLKFAAGLFEQPYVDLEKTRKVFSITGRAEGRRLAMRIAEKSVVLLKNEGLLPLKGDLRAIAVIGPHADEPRNYLGDYHFPAHIEQFSGGSGGVPKGKGVKPQKAVEELKITTVLAAVKAQVSSTTRVLHAQGCDVVGSSKEWFAEAVQMAEEADVAVVVVGDRSGMTQECTSGETRDLAGLRLPGVQEELVRAVARTGTPVVLVLCVGRPYVLTQVIDQVGAALVAWLSGEAGGEAIAEVLFGKIAPGGKLPISFPRSAGQLPVYYARKPSGGRPYFWGSYVDEVPEPLFPFGHGLSYTSFDYSDLKIEPREVAPAGTVRMTLKAMNSGDREGDEVVQLYLGRERGSVTRPVKELKGFCRLSLRPGEEKRIRFEIPVDALAYYDQDMHLVVEPGEYRAMVGSSSADIRLTGGFQVVGDPRPICGKREYFSYGKVEEGCRDEDRA